MTTNYNLLSEIEAHYPDADCEWLYEDYQFYWRHFEDEQDNGNIGPEDQMLTFHAWLDEQPTDYLDAHNVPNNL